MSTILTVCEQTPVCNRVCARESVRETKSEDWVRSLTMNWNTHSNLCPHHPHCLSLSSSKSMVVNWSVRSPSVFACFFCAALQMVSVVTWAPSAEGKWFLCWRITGFSQTITGSCRHHQSLLSGVWLSPAFQTQISVPELFHRCLSTSKCYATFNKLWWWGILSKIMMPSTLSSLTISGDILCCKGLTQDIHHSKFALLEGQ